MIEFVETYPGKQNFNLFEEVLQHVYSADSVRHMFPDSIDKKNLHSCYVFKMDGKVCGRYALYLNPQLQYQSLKSACIGLYECIDNDELSFFILEHANRTIFELGYKFIIGPMEGSTWNNYRFSLSNDHPNFFLEPYHNAYYNEQWKKAGFEEIAHFHSSRADIMPVKSGELSPEEDHFRSMGISFRFFNMEDFENELNMIGEFSISAFKKNFLYTPISIEEFVSKYEKVKAFMDPRFICLAFNEKNELVGMVFCLIDHLDKEGKTLIIKTLVRNIDPEYKGLGSYLGRKISEVASDLGFTSFIHAFMKDNNASRRVSGKLMSKPYKEYGLYGKAVYS